MPCKRQKRGAPQRCTCHPILKQPWSANEIRNDVSKPLKAAKVCYCHVSWDAGCTHIFRIYEIMHMDYTWRSQCWGRVSKTHKECKAPNRSLPSRFKFIIVDPCLSTPLLAQKLHLLPKSLWWGSFLQRYPWNSRPTWPARRCHRLLLFPHVPSIRPVCPQKNFGDLKGHFWGSYNWSCQGLQRDTACTFGCLLLQILTRARAPSRKLAWITQQTSINKCPMYSKALSLYPLQPAAKSQLFRGYVYTGHL